MNIESRIIVKSRKNNVVGAGDVYFLEVDGELYKNFTSYELAVMVRHCMIDAAKIK